MASKDEATQLLIVLGLTLSQARIYLTLSHSGACTVKTISKFSQVAREHVYEVMPQLQDLGLVEKIIGTPSKFNATPIQEGLHTLFQRRTRKTREMQKQKMELIKSCKNNKLEGYFKIISSF